jgi:hypothetical protein
LRSAELGFLGVVVYTRVHTPRFCGEAARAGTLDFQAGSFLPVRINWVVVAINTFRGPFRYIEGPLIQKLKICGLMPGTRVPERQRPAIVGTGRAGVKAIAASQQ